MLFRATSDTKHADWHASDMTLSRMAAGLALLLVLPLLAATPSARAESTVETTAVTCDPMTLRQRAAQSVAVGLPGTSASRAARHLVKSDAGSVILFSRNIEGADQLKTMLRRLRAAAPHRLLVGVDEEGGRVARLGSAGLVHRVPAARWLGQNVSADNVEYRGRRLGREMKDLGVNWNLAPVYDVSNTAGNSVIGDRSYSSRPGKVARYGGAFARGLDASGVRATAKHFPGHGRTTTDSHDVLPTIKASRSELWDTDILPYRRAKEDLTAVMTAHVRYPGLDINGPASLSARTYRLLRRDVGFRGLAVTDALEMGAITRNHTVPEAAEKAVAAGADMALATDWRKADPMTDRLVNAVRAGRLSRQRLDTAARRVLRAKGYGSERIACLVD